MSKDKRTAERERARDERDNLRLLIAEGDFDFTKIFTEVEYEGETFADLSEDGCDALADYFYSLFEQLNERRDDTFAATETAEMQRRLDDAEAEREIERDRLARLQRQAIEAINAINYWSARDFYDERRSDNTSFSIVAWMAEYGQHVVDQAIGGLAWPDNSKKEEADAQNL